MTSTPNRTQIRYSVASDDVSTLLEEVHDDFLVGHDVSRLLGLDHSPERSATTKTIKMRDRDITATDGTLLASLSGMSTTVTKMTDPHDGTHWLFIAFKYRATARGWHTVQSIPHGLYFLNRDGGPIFSWGFPANDFSVNCGWVDHEVYFPVRDHDYVSWFSDWRRVSWRLSEGYFYPC